MIELWCWPIKFSQCLPAPISLSTSRTQGCQALLLEWRMISGTIPIPSIGCKGSRLLIPIGWYKIRLEQGRLTSIVSSKSATPPVLSPAIITRLFGFNARMKSSVLLLHTPFNSKMNFSGRAFFDSGMSVSLGIVHVPPV